MIVISSDYNRKLEICKHAQYRRGFAILINRVLDLVNQQEEVFDERLSILFKKLRIVRIVDRKRNTLVYLTYSDRLVEGSPRNSITAVPVPASTPIPVK